MPFTLSDIYDDPHGSDDITPVRAVPSADALFARDAGGTWRPLGPQEASINEDGTYTLTLPRPSESRPTEVTWSLTFPDHTVWAGTVPESDGPMSLGTLVSAHGWELVEGVASGPEGTLDVANQLNVGDGEHDGVIIIKLKAGQTLLPFSIVNSDDQTKFGVAVDGETILADDLFAGGWVKAVEAVTAWGVTGPSSRPLLATGAGHTADDIIALLQSYGFCRQS